MVSEVFVGFRSLGFFRRSGPRWFGGGLVFVSLLILLSMWAFIVRRGSLKRVLERLGL